MYDIINSHLYRCKIKIGGIFLADIRKMRQAFDAIYPNMPIMEFVNIAGYPDSCVGSLDEGILTWMNSVWKGILRGGTIYRKVIVFTKKGEVVQFSSENLNVSSW